MSVAHYQMRPARLLAAATTSLVALYAFLAFCQQGPLLVSADVRVTWAEVAPMPHPVGETSAGILRGPANEPLLVVVGYDLGDETASRSTMVLDINANRWSIKAERPHVGHHMAAATVNNILYLIGGFLDDTPGSMQMYDPITDTWTDGPKPPFRTAAAAATAMGNTIYVCGGLRNGDPHGGAPMTTCASFDVPSNRWQMIRPMPHALHHPSMGTDGRRVYVFGGRSGFANSALYPSNHTQIYDPQTGTWRSDAQQNGGPRAMPVGRGGMGGAVYLKGQFYVMGGEVRCARTWMGACPNPRLSLSNLGVVNRIDRYNPDNDSWDRGLPGMSLGRHGAYPVVGPAPNSTRGAADPVVYVCGGGVKQSYSSNTFCGYMRVP